ncbi:MAG: PBP1A family penicillin-binding protein [Candidatus Cryosericum sp.]|nr:PBP1A family penicillin-binding protein [Candidatus Cryosericum sp.]HPS69455.1 PBP1A family penicillin-binding protein [Candidatus Cryosericum sp.]
MTATTKPTHRTHPRPRVIVGWILIALLAIGIAGGATLALVFAHYATQVPPVGSLSIQTPKASQIFDRNDNLLSSVYFEENRLPKSLSEISETAIKALIASEDERFFSHGAIDIRGILVGLIVDPLRGQGFRGASTLTQQLARQAILHDTEVTLPRKIKEMIVAYRLEKQYTKEEVLNMYLNYVYFGNGLYGIEAAALGYFGVHARDLDAAQSAMIIGVLPAPSAYNPYADLEKATEQQHLVLHKMVRNHYLTQEEADAAAAEKLTFKNGMKSPYGSVGWFVDYVKSIVQKQYGSDLLYQGGLRIYTTIDPKLQQAALSAVQTVWDKAKQDKVFVESDRDSLGVFQPQAALVSVDPKTGYILAMVGGTDYDETNFNRVLAARQPGSTFKLFDYTAAIDNGVTFPSEIVASQPTDFGGWNPPEWLGTNQWFGRISVANAIKESSNIIAAKTTLRAGLDRVIYYARKMGVTSPLKPYVSISIGSFEVTPLEMVEAYATVANGGVRITPYPIRRIETENGTLIEQHDFAATRVIPEATAWIIQSMLRGVYENTPNARISGLQAAGKTGSTNDWRDAWYDGFTPELCTVIHVGADAARAQMSAIRNAGSRFPAMTWKAYMQQAIKLVKQTNFGTKPDGVSVRSVCDSSGLLATDACPTSSVHSAYFLSSHIPTETCTVHPPILQTVRLAAIDPSKLAPADWPDSQVIIKTLRRDQIPTEVYGQTAAQTDELHITCVPQQVRAGQQVTLSLDVTSPMAALAVSFDVYVAGSRVATVSSLPTAVTYTPTEAGSLTVSVIGRTANFQNVLQVTSAVPVEP